jgi:hypothetical protein
MQMGLQSTIKRFLLEAQIKLPKPRSFSQSALNQLFELNLSKLKQVAQSPNAQNLDFGRRSIPPRIDYSKLVGRNGVMLERDLPENPTAGNQIPAFDHQFSSKIAFLQFIHHRYRSYNDVSIISLIKFL